MALSLPGQGFFARHGPSGSPPGRRSEKITPDVGKEETMREKPKRTVKRATPCGAACSLPETQPRILPRFSPRISSPTSPAPGRAGRPALSAVLALLLAVFCGLAPRPALADQTNPAGNTITGQNPGLAARADGERLTNLGGIEVTAGTGEATGMGDNSPTSFRGLILTNSGFITATANADAYAYGMWAGDDNRLSNSGSIIVTTTGSGAASGMWAGSDSRLTNSGSIIAAGAGHNAYGMQGNANSRLSNSGSIIVTATGSGAAFGMWAGSDSRLTNSGSVTAIGTNGTSAYGMAVGSGTAANYGHISVSSSGGNAYELFNLSPRDTVRIAAWALDLRDFSHSKVFGSNGGPLDFNGSCLILRPGSEAQGFVWGREYKVADMIDNTYGQGRGAVASVMPEKLPELLEATLKGSTVADQTVSLSPRVNADTDPGLHAARDAVGTARVQMGQVNSMLAGQLALLAPPATQGAASGNAGASGLPAGDAVPRPDAGRWLVFGAPYFSSTANHDQDFTSNSVGFVAGGTYRFNERFAAGLHLGYSGGRSWGDLMDMDNDARSGLFGLHALFNATPEWYLRGQFTGFATRYGQDYRSGQGQNALSADADFNSHGLYAALNTGYAWRINESNTLTPEIGLSWLWSHQDGFNLDWKDRAGVSQTLYTMDYDAQDYNALDGTAMLRWRGDFALGGEKAGSLRPALGLGVRQRLTDTDVESSMRFAGSSFSTRVSEDATTLLAEAGLEWNIGGFSAGLAYTGEYGAQQEVHTGWVTMKFEF